MPKPDGQQYVITFRKNFLKTMYCIQAIFRFLQVANVSLTNCFAFLDRSRWLHQEICSWLMIQLLCKFLRDPEKKHFSFCNQNTVHHKSENDGLRRWGSLRWSVQLFSSKKCQGRTKQHGDEHICTMMWTGGGSAKLNQSLSLSCGLDRPRRTRELHRCWSFGSSIPGDKRNASQPRCRDPEGVGSNTTVGTGKMLTSVLQLTLNVKLLPDTLHAQRSF